MKHKRKVTLSLAAALALTLSGAIAAIAPADVAAEENATNKQTFDFTTATSFDDVSMFSVGIDPSTNSTDLGYTSDSWVTYEKAMSDLFTLEKGLKVDASKYSGDEVSENRIYVRYNVETMKYFEAELTYRYDSSDRNGWAGLILGYTNYERRAHWNDSPYGAEFFVEKEGKGNYSADKLNNSNYTAGSTPANWTEVAEHTLSIVADENGITFSADGTELISLTTAELAEKNYVLSEGSVGFMFTNAQFTAKSFSVTNLSEESDDNNGEEESETYAESYDFTAATDIDDLSMFSAGIDPKDNSYDLGYTSDPWVTYEKSMSDLFKLESGLKVDTSKYSGDDVSENNIYVRYNAKTMKYFKAELTYSYDSSDRNGWAGFILGYTDYTRKARWQDNPYGAEFFVQKEGKGTYSAYALNGGGFTEGTIPDGWTENGEHTLSIVVDENGITFSADGTVVISLTKEYLATTNYTLSEGSIGFMFTNAQFTAKSFKVTDLSMAVKAQTNSDQNAIRFVSAVDSLDYAKVGFEISVDVNGTTKTVTVETTKVYTSLLANGTKFYSTEFGVEDGYLFAYTVTGVPSADTQFTVRAYVVTNDGETVYGEANVLKISDANA